MTRAQVDGDSAAVMNYMMEFYLNLQHDPYPDHSWKNAGSPI